MNILLTNDDGFEAPGLRAAFEALDPLGKVHVVAPETECSACGHAITISRPISVRRVSDPEMGEIFAINGTPADCVRLAQATLILHEIDLVVSGINRGANAGVDTYYSGTIAAAREGAMLGLKAMAFSQAIRDGVETDWAAAGAVAHQLVESLLESTLPGPGFWSVNFPAPIPPDPHEQIRHVPTASHPAPLLFDEVDSSDGRRVYAYGAPYWTREVAGPTDYSVIRDGGIAVTAIPLFGRF